MPIRPSPPPALLLVPAALLSLALPAGQPPAAVAAARGIAYVDQVADQNAVGLDLTNYGFLGNNFVLRSPSLEYPLGTNYEHLTHAGLWVGAHAVDGLGAFTGVTTAALDGTTGVWPMYVSEFTPSGDAIALRSSRVTSPYYDPAAVSEMDYIADFDDLTPKTTSWNPEDHRPLGLRVRLEAFTWSFAGLEHVLFLRYVIRNAGTSPLTDAWVGLYTEFASGDRSFYASWPPNSSSPVGAWFSKKWVVYEDSLRLLREHYCYASPVPAGCVLARVPEWVGLQFLGASAGGTEADSQVTVTAWNYYPRDPALDQDVERYARMSAGTVLTEGYPLLVPPFDPIELFAVGPFPSIAPDDSVVVDFAMVGGAEIADIEAHARIARQLRDAAFDITVPAAAALVSAVAEPGLVRLRWQAARGAGFGVERSEDGAAWTRLALVAPDGTGAIVYEDRAVEPGHRYGYRLESAGAAPLGETWVEVPAASAFALHGLRPNPAAGGRTALSFALAAPGEVRLEVFDTNGRRVLARTLGALGPGEHVVALGDAAPLAPGTYFLRLTQGRDRATARAVVLE